jgi:membrane fusion protein (multidrug efflux system)
MNSNRTLPISGLLAGALLATACDDQPSAAGSGWGGPNAATKVITAVLQPQRLVDEIEALGTAKANESIEITPRISSVVTRVHFEEGQLVQAGELLVDLENSEILAQLAVAEASLKETTSIYNRSRSLIDTQVISAAELEELLAAMQVDMAEVEAAKARLAHTSIRAPFRGRVGLRRVSPGGFVNTSTVITTLDDTETIKLDFSIPETFLTVVDEGMAIAAQSLVYPDRDFAGEVLSVDTRLDPVSRSIRVRAIMPNPDGALKPGMFLTVNLKRDRGEVLVAPEEAIVPEGGQQFVFRVEQGVAVKQAVTLGRRVPGSVEIVSGLSENDMIVTEGTHKIRDGSKLEVLDQHAATGAGTNTTVNP